MADLAREEARNLNKLAIVEKFMARLGDARTWEYDGVILDGGKGSRAECVCGHAIRWIFVIQKIGNPSMTAQVGSECINHFASYNPDLYQRLLTAQADLSERLKAEKKALKDAEEAAALTEAGQEFAKVRAEAKAIVRRIQEHMDYHSRGFLPKEVYYLRSLTFLDRQFKTTRGRIKWVVQHTLVLTRQIAIVESQYQGFVAEARTRLRETTTPELSLSQKG